MTAEPERRQLSGIPPLNRRRAGTTPAPTEPPSSVVAWAWYVDGVRKPAESLTEAAHTFAH